MVAVQELKAIGSALGNLISETSGQDNLYFDGHKFTFAAM